MAKKFRKADPGFNRKGVNLWNRLYIALFGSLTRRSNDIQGDLKRDQLDKVRKFTTTTDLGPRGPFPGVYTTTDKNYSNIAKHQRTKKKK